MDQPTPKEPRGPVSLRIKFRSASLDQFIERYAVDVSRGGIFIRTREPLPVGTQLRFDFQLQDAAPLLAGEGTIVWIRENDPNRAGVTPGMGVRFDKLTPPSQPVLEKILTEKALREQAGAPTKTGPAGGMAVRRPSSTFSALDPAAARAAQAASGPPRVGGLSPLGTQPRPAAPATAPAPPRPTAPAPGAGALGAQPRATAPAIGSGPIGAQPRTTAPAIGSDPFGTGRAGTRPSEGGAPAPTPEAAGAFGRPRSTTGMNAQRPAPAPSALFEKPTADDIDRALSVLTEVDGPAPAPLPVPADFSSRVRRPTDAQPMVVESKPDVAGAPSASHRRPTDAQPMILESAPAVGSGPSRRSATRPLFSGTGEVKLPELDAKAASDAKGATIPVIPIGGPSADDSLDGEDEEDDATSAWIGSGPTRVGGEPELPAAASAPALPKPPAAPALEAPPLDLADTAPGVGNAPAAPSLMAPSFAPPLVKKKGSGAAIGLIVVLLAAGGGGYYFLKGPGRSLLSGASPAPAPTTASAGTAPAAAPEGAPAVATTATDAAAEPEKAAETPAEAAKKAEPEEAKAGEAKSGEAKPSEDKPAEAKAEPKSEPAEPKAEPKHRKRHASSEGSEAAAAAAVADVSPAPAGDAPAAEAPAKAAGTGHVIKISSSPAGAEVIVDGSSMGTTPFSSGDVDPALPHSVTIKKDGFEAYEHMISGSDWPHAKNGVRTLRLNAKLHETGGESAKPAETDTPGAATPGLGTTPASPKRE